MTIIIGYTDGKNIDMIADGGAVNDTIIQNIAHPKIFKIIVGKHEMLIGYTTSFRMGQLLQFYIEEELSCRILDENNVYRFLCTEFIQAVRIIFKEHGFRITCENQQEYGGTFLIGFMGRLYTVQDNYAVLEFKKNFACIGCGEDLAIASMATLESLKKYLPTNLTHSQRTKLILTTALSVVSNYNTCINYDNYTILGISNENNN